MEDPIVPPMLADDPPADLSRGAPPTLVDLIRENRLLIFRAALLQAQPAQALARYFVQQNRRLRAALRAAMRNRLHTPAKQAFGK